MSNQDKVLCRVYADIGCFEWNKDMDGDEAAFRREVIDCLCIPGEFPSGDLVLRSSDVSNVVAVYDGDEIVAIVTNNRGK